MGIARDQADMAAAIRDHHERLRAEEERRLARYDEAIRLIEKARDILGDCVDGDEFERFIDDESSAAEGRVAG